MERRTRSSFFAVTIITNSDHFPDLNRGGDLWLRPRSIVQAGSLKHRHRVDHFTVEGYSFTSAWGKALMNATGKPVGYR